MPVRLDLRATTRNGRGETMIRLPAVDGHEVELYEPLDAQLFLGVSANTLSKWRREGWIRGPIPIGRGYAYTKDALAECLKLRRVDVKNKGVEYV
jgi:hypothetical protein